MLHLLTGLPGSGKTLFTIQRVEKLRNEGRTVYYHGIPDLRLPWVLLDDPTKWHELPTGSVVVIDEAQRFFRPRYAGAAVPPHVSALETHRHKGFDLFLITQHPTLIDQNVRRLVGAHFHLMRKFGAEWSTVHEFFECREHPDKFRKDSATSEFGFPKDLYGVYRSAEAHTHKLRIPKKVVFAVVLPVLLLGFAWYQFSSWSETIFGEDRKAILTPAAEAAAPVYGAKSVSRVKVDDYFAVREARVPGLDHTAPVYDPLTVPKAVPAPVACVASADRCWCYTEQGTRMPSVEPEVCRQIVKNGYFVAWAEKSRAAAGADERPRPPAREEPPAYVVINPPAAAKGPAVMSQ